MQRQNILRASGGVAVGITMATILLATLLSPEFSWTANALSNLGVTDTGAGTSLTVLLFNGGLIAGGTAGLVFAVVLAQSLPTLGGWILGGLFALTMMLMAGVGVFPQNSALHFPVAVSFYLFLSLSLWADGLAALRRGWRERATAGLALGLVNIAGWIGWGLTGSIRREGLAIPEIVGALALSVWAVWLSLGLIRGRWVLTSNA